MPLDEQIMEVLKQEYNAGQTQQEIAEKHQIPQSYIQRLLCGKRPASGITVKVLMKMFPRMAVFLDGCPSGLLPSLPLHSAPDPSDSSEKSDKLEIKIERLKLDYEVKILSLERKNFTLEKELADAKRIIDNYPSGLVDSPDSSYAAKHGTGNHSSGLSDFAFPKKSEPVLS